MQRHRVIDFGADVARGEEFAQPIPPLRAYYVLVKNVMGMRRSFEQADGRVVFGGPEPSRSQEAVVGRGPLLPLPVPSLDVWQFHPQNRGLDRIHAAVPAHLLVQIKV